MICSPRRRRPWRLAGAALGWALLGLPFAAQATVESDISLENTVSNLLPARASLSGGGEGEEQKGLHFALVPQVGYGPETGPKVGVKFEGQDLFGGHTFADLNLLVALNAQQKAVLTVGNPLLGDWMAFGTLSWYRDPSQEFFGIGNNNVGPEELSNHDIRRARAGGLIGYRLMRRVAVTMSAFYRETDVKPGEDDGSPSTTKFAPRLPGIGGARSNYLAWSLVYNSRDETVRPTRGWEVIFKYLWSGHALVNDDADYSKLMLDTSYMVPLVWRRQVIAFHGNTEAIFGHTNDIPFFELSSLGGDETMRGYFPNRFLGKGRLVFNAEYRLTLTEFNFRKMWDVSIDGVAFGDAGRVYEDADDFTHAPFKDFRFSYGGGMRMGFSSGMVVRLDVGFSPEETGLVYLTFGHTF